MSMAEICIRKDLSVELGRRDDCLFLLTDVQVDEEKNRITWRELSYIRMVVR